MLFLFVGINVYSQEPSPTPTILSQPQQNKTKPKQTKSNNLQRGSEELPVVVKIIPPDGTKSEEKRDTTPTNNNSSRDWLLITFTGLLAIFTGLLWKSTKKIDQTSRLRDRARVYFSDPVVVKDPPQSPDAVGSVLVSIRNIGNMQATVISFRCGWVYRDASENIQDPFPLIENFREIIIPKFIGPKQRFNYLQGADAIPNNKIIEAENRKINIFIAMEVIYYDGFDFKNPRITQACRSWRFDKERRFTWGFVGPHNCTDDDCKE